MGPHDRPALDDQPVRGDEDRETGDEPRDDSLDGGVQPHQAGQHQALERPLVVSHSAGP